MKEVVLLKLMFVNMEGLLLIFKVLVFFWVDLEMFNWGGLIIVIW